MILFFNLHFPYSSITNISKPLVFRGEKEEKVGRNGLNLVFRNPVDTGRKLNVHKTFNLRHVSTGEVIFTNIFLK